MSKNATIIAEIISEEINKMEVLTVKQSKVIEDFKILIEDSKNLSINTERLEDVIKYWNDLFERQKKQIVSIQEKQILENRIHRVLTYLFLTINIIFLILNKF